MFSKNVVQLEGGQVTDTTFQRIDAIEAELEKFNAEMAQRHLRTDGSA